MFEMPDLKCIAPMGQFAPDAMAAFKALDQSALAEGAIQKKYKELMAIAVALTNRSHRKDCARASDDPHDAASR